MTIGRLTPENLLSMLEKPEELAVLDLREAGQTVLKRLFRAAPMPLWRLEAMIDAAAPNRRVPIALTDLDGSLTREGAEKLERLGYKSVFVLEGGTLAWEKAGYEVFIDQNLPSKAFGEFIEKALDTPRITALELHEKMEAGENLVILDGRTPEEFRNFSLPGACNVPNGELALRAAAYAPKKETAIVVNCAGRTRSIIGCQTLLSAGLPNKVMALENGTLGWLLAGFDLEVGPSRDKAKRAKLKDPDPKSLEKMRLTLRKWLAASGASVISERDLKRFAKDQGRTSYLFDTRTEIEYASGHLEGFRHVPGGQLVQATDRYAPVIGARAILADFDGVRGVVAAAWLAQAGAHEVSLLPVPLDSPLVTGRETKTILPDPRGRFRPRVSPEKALEMRKKGAAIYDVDNSASWFLERIEGSKFCSPNRLQEALAGGHGRAVLTSKDGILAWLVARNLEGDIGEVSSILGGTAAWMEAKLAAESGPGEILSGEEDIRRSACEYGQGLLREHSGATRADFENYLEWEKNLPNQIGKPGAAARFRAAPPPGPRRDGSGR